MSLKLGNTVISGVTTPIDGSIAIGQIISSIIPLTDAGLHLLDGALIPGGGVYDDFVQYIAGLSSSYPQCFTDETTWQNTVSSKGACGKFVYDSTNNTVRLPKITGFIEGTIDSSALGDLVNAGLPNITHTHTRGSMNITGSFSQALGMITNKPITGTGAFSNGSYSQSSSRSGTNENYWQSVNTVNFNAANNWTGSTSDNSIVNSIYGNSSTVQPQSIKVFYYIVIATTTKTDIEVDIDEIVTDLNAKAVDADVVHKTGNETISGVKITTARIEMQSTNGSTSPELLFHIPGVRYSRLVETSNGLEVQDGSGTILDRLYAGSSDEMNTVVITTGINKSPNGYVKLGNGLIIQWGLVTNMSNNKATVNFPTPFTDIPQVVTTSDKDGVNDGYNSYVSGTTTTGFNAFNKEYGTSLNCWVHWIAIGY